MKKFLALALALAMTLSLAACGGKTDDSASDEDVWRKSDWGVRSCM